MDGLGIRQMKNTKKHSRGGNCKKDIKVVYISSPMKFKTSASQFRALVQELTGKESDAAARFLEDFDSSENSLTNSDAARVVNGLPLANSHHESVFEPFDDELLSEGSFLGMFAPNMFHDPSHFDAIGSFSSL